jgi:hypothetical protein
MAVVTFSRATRVRIDLNVRARHGLVRAGFEDANGPLSVGDEVVVFLRRTPRGVRSLTRPEHLPIAWRYGFPAISIARSSRSSSAAVTWPGIAGVVSR